MNMMKSPLMCGITAAAVTLFLLTSHTTVACYSQSPSTRPNQGLSDKVPGSKEYDQEVFLGKDIASEFHKQTTRETMRRLQLIVMKIDSNSDDSVDPEELRQWINATHVKFIQSSSDVHFTELLGEEDKDGSHLSWAKYDAGTYSFVDSKMYEIEAGEELEVQKQRKKDAKRWEKSDTNSDGMLDRGEFPGFLYPEEFEHTRGNYMHEMQLAVDADGDGKIDLEEYLNDLMSAEKRRENPEAESEETELFHSHMDKDGDGFLSGQEVVDWLFPVATEVDAEVKHLFEVADADRDGLLSLREVLENVDTFAGSKATEWGEALKMEL